MLSGSGSDAYAHARTYNRLQRSKSSSSVQERKKRPIISEPIDPETAHLHALIAAHRAMERSSGRHSEDLWRSRSSASKRRTGRPLASRAGNANEHVQFSPETEWRRQKMGLQARQKRRPPPSIASSAPHAPSEISSTYIEEHQYGPSAPASEFGAAPSGENYGAEPSSYRRLRRAKSLLTPKRRAMSIQNLKSQASPINSRTLRNANSSIGLSEQGSFRVGLRRSFSFLRPSSGSFAKNVQRAGGEASYHGEAVQIAREQYLKNMEEQTLRPKTSMSFHPRIRRDKKAFRRSVRTNATTMFGDGVKSQNQQGMEEQPESRIRTLSASFRDRVKGLFSKSVSNKDKFPPQQLKASKRHFGNLVDGSGAEGQAFDAYAAGAEEESTRRNSLYIPSEQDSDALEDLDKLSSTLRSAVSRESMHSAARSRVTSWTNSTVTGGRETPLERNRLSIIKEDGGPHQPSSSAGRHIGGVSVFQEPIGPGPVDSQRIYSALMRRIDQEQAEMDRAQRELDEIHQERQQSNQKSWRNTGTIRAVQSEASLRTIQQAPDAQHREFSLGEHDWHDHSEEESPRLSPQQHKENVERRRARLAIQEAQSSFFPFSGGEEKPKGVSPFKAALLERHKYDPRITEESEDMATTNDSRSFLHHRQTSRGKQGDGSSSARHGFGRSAMMSDESVYSRTTCGGKNDAYKTPVGSSDELGLPPARSEEDGNGRAGLGMATIIPTRINRYPRPSERVGPLVVRKNSGASARTTESQQWRGWMEKEIGHGLERQQSRASERSLGHMREHAQIDDDDVEVGSEETVRTKNRFPLLELKEVSRGNTPVPRRSGSGGRGLVKSQSGLLLTKKTSMSNVNGNDENKKSASSTLRKISPGNVAKMLKGKTSGMFASGAGKENRTPTPSVVGSTSKEDSMRGKAKQDSESPPVSTPGRLMMMYGKPSNGRLRNKNSDLNVTPTGNRLNRFPISNNSPASSEGNQSNSRSGSDSGGKKGLSARLSRPFDMDVPGHNRPFDSMFLGKSVDVMAYGANSDPQMKGKGRLSVAPPSGFGGTQRGEMGYGGLGGGPMGPGDGDATREGSGTPSSANAYEVKGVGAKRMVSDFLRRRRGKSESAGAEGSPAFV